jgi:hypothetical protein
LEEEEEGHRALIRYLLKAGFGAGIFPEKADDIMHNNH